MGMVNGRLELNGYPVPLFQPRPAEPLDEDLYPRTSVWSPIDLCRRDMTEHSGDEMPYPAMSGLRAPTPTSFNA